MTVRPAGRAGFTLIELILVLTLVAVMASIISPIFRITPARQVENAAHLMATQLEMARAHALSERRLVRVQMDVAGGTYTAYADHDGDDSISVATAEIDAFAEFGVRSLPDLVAFGRGSATAVPGDASSGAVTLPGTRVELNDRGFPEPWGTMGTVYLVHQRDSDAVSAISVASSGSFKAWRWDGGSGTWR